MADEGKFEPFPKAKKDKDNKQQPVYDFSNDFIQLGRRIKVIEEGVNNLRRKILINEQNDLNRHKRALAEEKTTISEINEVKKEIENIKKTIKEFISELKNSARREDVNVLKKYIDMWNPINFVTEETVKNLIEEKLKKE